MVYVLKRCPFCGKLPAEILDQAKRSNGICSYKIECENDDCIVMPRALVTWIKKDGEPWDDIEDLKKAWNKRK